MTSPDPDVNRVLPSKGTERLAEVRRKEPDFPLLGAYIPRLTNDRTVWSLGHISTMSGYACGCAGGLPVPGQSIGEA